jgi:predicted alpha/beta hydrolase
MAAAGAGAHASFQAALVVTGLRGIDDLVIATRDGVELAATHFSIGDEPRRVVALTGVLGVSRAHYGRFASFLQDRGMAVVSFDYRGMGESRDRPVRAVSATIEEFGYLDFEAVLGWLARIYPDAQRCVVGHGVGGQLIGLTQRALELRRIVAVSTGAGYWGHWPGAARLGQFARCFVAAPLLAHGLGFLPGSLLGLEQHLPRGVALDWARWGRDPDHLRSPRVGAKHLFFEEIAAPVLVWCLADDRYAPRPAVEAFLDWFPNAPVELRMAPALPAAGWFGADALWQATADFLVAD